MCASMSRVTATIVLLLSISCYVAGQTQQSPASGSSVVPRVVKFSGLLKDHAGNPMTGTQSISFTIYSDMTGGTPLWEEIQNVQLVNGRYTVLLGVATTDGIPREVFATNQPRWLAIRLLAPGEEEQPRAFLTSVPYALKAADADTLGGLPPSAYAKVGQIPPAQTVPSVNPSPAFMPVPGGSAQSLSTVVTTPGGTAGHVPLFSGSNSIINSDIQESGGIVKMPQLQAATINNLIFVDGARYSTLAHALDDCPAAGCTIDMRGNSNSSALELGTFDPGARAVTLLLGPYRYSAARITLRTNLQIIGYGSGTVSGGRGTQIISNSANKPLFVIPQANHTPAQFVLLRNFEILGAPGNTNQDCFFLDVSTLHDAGLRYSVFEQLQISGFMGASLHFQGTPNTFSGLNEWDQFRQLVVYRPTGGASAITMEGANGQIEFLGGQYDGTTAGEGTNIYVGTYSGGLAVPLEISFHKVTSQLANVGVNVNGCRMCHFQMHHEAINGVYLLTHTGTDASGDMVVIENTQFDNGSGVNGGNGYLVDVTTTQANVVFDHNVIAGTPDHVIQGTNGMALSASDNMFNTLPSNVYASFGVAYQVNPAATVALGRAHLVRLNPSTTCVSTLQSALGAGELVTFRALGNICFNSGGNMEFGSYSLPLNLAVGQTATFIRSDSDINFSLIATSIASGTTTTPAATIVTAAAGEVPGATQNSLQLSGAPPISANFGTASSVVATGTAAFTVIVGRNPSSSGTITLPPAATGWNCSAFDMTNPTGGGGFYVKQTGGSRSRVTLTGYNTSGAPAAWIDNDVLRVSCFPF
jgi:hypothetical protein